MSQPIDAVQDASGDLIGGLADYLVRCQERDGDYAGSFWSELAYHIPVLDYRAGGSHHNRTVGSAALAFMKLADEMPEHDLRNRARQAFDWIITRQHDDGGMFEITNDDKPSQFHLDFERSSISLGVVCHGLHNALQLGLSARDEYTRFLLQAARWQLTVETDPGNFLHTEGYPPDKLILNGSAHAAETLLIGASVADLPEEREQFRAGAVRAIEAIIGCQRDSGMLPYSSYADDNSISYTATVAWVLQNLIDTALLPPELRIAVDASLERATQFLVSCVREDGAIDWDTWENHGQKYHTWVYGLMARALAWHPSEAAKCAAARLVMFLRTELFNPEVRLCRLYDFPVGEERVVCGRTVQSEEFHECAYHQADLLDCLVDTRALLARVV